MHKATRTQRRRNILQRPRRCKFSDPCQTRCAMTHIPIYGHPNVWSTSKQSNGQDFEQHHSTTAASSKQQQEAISKAAAGSSAPRSGGSSNNQTRKKKQRRRPPHHHKKKKKKKLAKRKQKKKKKQHARGQHHAVEMRLCQQGGHLD